MRLSDLFRRASAAFTVTDRLFRLRERLAHRPEDRSRFSPRTPIRLSLLALEDRVVPDGRPLPLPTIFAGAGAGMEPIVKSFDADTGTLNFQVQAYEGWFKGGVHVATADFNADAIPEVVTGPGPGGGPRIRVFDGKTGEQLTSPIGSFFAYHPLFFGGVEVAAADVDGDGTPDVITAAGPGGGPHVKVFSGKTGDVLANFFAFDPDFLGGIHVAAADYTHDGNAEVIVGAGPGGGPHVKVYDLETGDPAVLPGPAGNFFAYGEDYRGGVWVGAGDVNGDGTPDVLTGPGAKHAPRVKVVNGADGTVMSDFAAFADEMTAGVRVGSAYVDDDPYADVVAGTGPGAAAKIRTFSAGTGKLVSGPLAEFSPFGAGELGGVHVAAANDPGSASTTFTAVTWDAGGSTPRPGQNFTFSTTVADTARLYGRPTGTVKFILTKMFGFPVVQFSVGSTTLTPAADAYTSSATLTVTDVVLEPSTNYYVHAEYAGDTTFAWNSSGSYSFGTLGALNPPPRPCDCTPCGPGGAVVGQPAGSPAEGGVKRSTAGGTWVADGVITVARRHLAGEGFGTPWGANWFWSNGPGYGDGKVGNGAGLAQGVRLAQLNGNDSLAMISSPYCTLFFDEYGSAYHSRYGDPTVLAADVPNGEFRATDGTGNVFKFYDFSGGTPAGRVGLLKSVTDAAGNVTEVTSWAASGQPAEVQRTEGTGGSALTESYLYAYVSGGVNDGLVSSVTQRRKVGTGSWTTVRSVEFTYYDGTGSNGLATDLKTAVVKDAAGNTIDTDYYRYYTASSSTGYAHGLKFAFGPEAYGRLTGALGASVDSLTDAQVDDYADTYLEYDASKRVTKHTAAGAGCSACSGGQGTYTFAYSSSTKTGGANSWKYKTVETLPDGNQNTYYANALGEVMLAVYKDVTTAQEWATFTQYDEFGRAVLTAAPSAVSGYSDTYSDLMNTQGGNYQYVRDSEGLVTTREYASSTTATTSAAGDADRYLKRSAIRRGETGTSVPQQDTTYLKRMAGGTDFFVPATSTLYRNADGTGGQTTSLAYTWQGSTAEPASVTATLPTVTTTQNGPGTATSTTTVYDSGGRPVWARDAAGFITYSAYDANTGAVTKRIADVDTTQTSTFANLPSGWTTPTGGGLHLTTTYEVDSQGRATKTTYPNGRVDYAVYDDDNLEVRKYLGWDGTNNIPTGPTKVVREDRAGNYTETLTMSATPTVSNGRPTGTEAIGSMQSLSRVYRNAAGQVSRTDTYFNLSGLTYSTSTALGTEGTHFYRIQHDFGKQGLVNRQVSPQGTIYRIEYDGQHRPVSEWVGTDDTPTSGFWAPTNLAGTDMTKVREYEYDDAGVGDGNLTKETVIPGGSAANRVTRHWYDWRNRRVVTKEGVETTEGTGVNRPLTHLTYDNLNRVTAVRRYDGDGVTVTTTNGVPDQPSGSLLRAYTVTSFDELGRAYRDQTYSVDSATGSVSSTSLATDRWFDDRGKVLKVSAPGGRVTKTAYDGAGRATTVYSTDGGGDSGYTDADDVTGDAVLEQAETTFDGSGNVLTTVLRQRFHDEADTGALGTPTTGVNARASYAGRYYDVADRLTATTDVGTNGGSAWTRPSSVPSRSDTVLVTSRTYDAAGREYEVTDPRGILTRQTYDALGRVTKTVENYVDGTVGDTDDKTTEFGYNGAGRTSLTARLTGGGYQTTEWVYGVTTSGGSTVASNDVVGATRWPDPSTGAASSGQQDAVTVNALGQKLTSTDRNGNVHTLAYDTLGRGTADAVTTLGTNVDGAVRRIETAYDGQGNPYLLTSYDAASGGAVVNQVQRTYNGLGQLTTEYQAVSGAVNTSTTPKVQYAYSEMAGGANHSRLTSTTYPSGFVLTANYAAGLPSTISRLSSLSDSGGTLESYDYLGLGTVVRRAHPQPGVDVTYLKQSGEANGDAGDQYTGLDRFGRVADQRWIKTSDGSHADRFQYGYDRNSNRLYRDNLLSNNYDELYHANGASAGYDGLNQLAEFRRGALSDANTDGVPDTVTTASRTQAWDPDAAGNFEAVTTDGSSQTRTHNRQNEVTAVSGATSPTHDANGNLITDETGRTLQYDAWNRVVGVNGSTRYAYDGLSRRAKEGTRELYYSLHWQVIEERASVAVVARYAWSPVYIDAMVLVDRDADGQSGNGLEERLYAVQDANWNITALVTTAGVVAERYAYDPFGVRTVLSASWVVQGASGYAWVYGHQAGRLDADTGNYYFRNRDLSASLMRWDRTDPIQFKSGDINFYRYVKNSPTSRIDPAGLKCQYAIHCWHVYDPITTVIPLGVHCGVTIRDDQGELSLDGSGGGINQINANGGFGEVWWWHQPFKDASDEICSCLRSYWGYFNMFRFPRAHLEGNSNWVLSCMVKACGLKVDWRGRPPTAYGIAPCLEKKCRGWGGGGGGAWTVECIKRAQCPPPAAVAGGVAGGLIGGLGPR